MVDITGILWLDNIIIPIITGGAIVSLIGILFDRLSRNRAEYVDMINKRIDRFSKAQPHYTKIAGFYLALYKSLQLQSNGQLDYKLLIFYISNILYHLELWRKETGGLVQLDDLESEAVIYGFMYYIHSKLQDSTLDNKFTLSSISYLRALIDENTTLESFSNDVKNKKYRIFNHAFLWLKEIENKGQLEEIQQRSYWYGQLIYMEINIMYQLYYGMKNITEFYNNRDILEQDLLLHLHSKYPNYYKRLCDKKIVKPNRFDL